MIGIFTLLGDDSIRSPFSHSKKINILFNVVAVQAQWQLFPVHQRLFMARRLTQRCTFLHQRRPFLYNYNFSDREATFFVRQRHFSTRRRLFRTHRSLF